MMKTLKALLALTSMVILGLLLSSSTSSAQPAGVGNGEVNWNGWTMTYGVESGSDGLRLGNVAHNEQLLMARISMPVMNVFYEIPGTEGGCGPYADLIGGEEYSGVFTNEFTQDGEQWLELAIEDVIGAYVIYQSFYFSESGVMDAHIFSRALQCNIYHEHLPFWRIDFDLDGAPNDQVIRLDEAGNYVAQGMEFDLPANAAVNHEWYVRDTETQSALRINFDDGTYNLPGEIVPETDYIENDLWGRNYKPVNEEIVWTGPPSREVGFNEDEPIDDLILWYSGFMPHSPEEGPDLWHSTGIRMQVVPDPLTTVPPTPIPPTAIPPTTVPPTTVPPTTVPPTTVPPTTVPPTTVPPTPVPPTGDCLFNADFTSSSNGFTAVDDEEDPGYVDASQDDDDGLTLVVGGVDNDDIEGLLGSWTRTCGLNGPFPVTVTLEANLSQASEYESDEDSLLGITINGQGSDLALISGNGNGGSTQTTGLQTYSFETTLNEGSNDISLDCFNSKKTYNDEITVCSFTSLTIEAVNVVPPTPTPPTPEPTPPSTGATVLTSGVPVDGIAGTQGSQQFFTIDVPADTATLEVVMTGEGDADLYTLFGGVPSDTSFDCRPYIDGSSGETCTISNPPAGVHNIMINGWAAFSNVTLTASAIPPTTLDCMLENGIATTGLAGVAGDSIMCTVEVPEGAQNLSFAMTGAGDADLYTRFGSEPTLSAYDCRPYVDGSSVETCPDTGATVNPTPGTWYVMVNGWAAFSDVAITASWNIGTGGGTNELTSGVPVFGLSGVTGSQQFFTIEVTDDTALLIVALGDGTGDADLYVRSGAAPTLSAYDCRPYVDGTNEETCTIENPTPGTYHVMVQGYASFADATLTAALAVPAEPEVPETETPA